MKKTFFAGKTVLVTGGTGTFGHAFVTRMLLTDVRRVIVLSRDEFKQNEMRKRFGNDERLRFFIGDVRDRDRLERAFRDVDIVVHAAALKQVPATEYNPMEAIKTNIMGTQNVVDAALSCGIERVLTISSDKAVHPINLYGATKLCAEKLTVAANIYRRSNEKKPLLSVMRYGNILGSRGSFLELVDEQRTSGTITVTDERMTRFWIRIERIMDLIVDVLEHMHGGEIFVPKMESLKILDVVRCVAPDCSIKYIGVRPGEKLHEMLITEHEARRTVDIGGMYVIRPEHLQFDDEVSIPGKSVQLSFTYASDHPNFLRDVEHAPRILSVPSTVRVKPIRKAKRSRSRK
ncbi:SDR family NAD(P)-dependent oxidoreductase [Candidatus Kaiserbacteria bacterium]|nr:SDR family NAD(P)-dependent oxidoreductase [Candidatus Kaiserbacteria bacterium]